jgi:hypothetical protein
MRPGQNKRLRGRPGRKGPNPLTRSFESNGPDVKIRGTAQHVAEKYLQLARDAQSSGDIVLAENLLQHAEHYFRLIAAAQAQNNGYGRANYEAEIEDDDDDFVGVPDRFASLAERLPPNPAFAAQQPNFQPPSNYAPPQPQPQPPPQPHFQPPAPQPQPFEERPAYAEQRHERPVRNDRSQFGRGRRPEQSAEHGGEGGERGQFGFDRNRDRPRFQQRREPAPLNAEQPVIDEAAAAGLPAFITGPAISVSRAATASEGGESPAGGEHESREGRAAYHLSSRRRRRPRDANDTASDGEAPAAGELPLSE